MRKIADDGDKHGRVVMVLSADDADMGREWRVRSIVLVCLSVSAFCVCVPVSVLIIYMQLLL